MTRGGKRQKTSSRSSSPSPKVQPKKTTPPLALSVSVSVSLLSTTSTNSDTPTNNQKPINSSSVFIQKNMYPPSIILSSISLRKAAPAVYKLPDLDQLNCPQRPLQRVIINIRTVDIKHFRLLQKTLVALDTELHTFNHPSERSIKIVIKGIFTDISDSEISDKLTNLNFEIKHLRRFDSPGTPIYLVIFALIPNVKGILEINSIFYSKVSVEAYKNSSPAQCFKFQRIYHNSQNCGHAPRRVLRKPHHCYLNSPSVINFQRRISSGPTPPV